MASQDKAAVVTKAHVVSSASHTLVSSKPWVSVPDYSPDLGVPTAPGIACGFPVGWSQAGALNSHAKFKGHFQVPNISI